MTTAVTGLTAPTSDKPDLTDEDLLHALFAAPLERSDGPDAERIVTTIKNMLEWWGTQWCANVVATEYGEHPATAVPRMSWVRELLTQHNLHANMFVAA